MSGTTTDRADSSVAAEEERSARPDHHRSVRAAVIWSYVLTVGRYSVTGVVTFLLAALLNPREFGVMALAMVWVWFAQVLAQHGPAMAVIQRETVSNRHFDGALVATLTTSVMLAGLLAMLAPLWAAANGVPELAKVCWALTPAIVLNGLAAIPDAVLRRQLRFRALSVRVLLAGGVSGVVGIGMALAGHGVWALVGQQLTQSAVSCVAVWLAVDWRPRGRGALAGLRDIRRFSGHSVAEFLGFAAASRADVFFLGAYFGPVAIGLYRFALRLVEMVMELAAGGLNQVTLPDLSRFSSDRPAFAARLGKIIYLGMLIALPALGILAGVAEVLLALLGPEWVEAAAALRVLCLAGAFMVLGTILSPAIQAFGRPGTGAVLGWSEAACMVAAVLVTGNLFRSASLAAQASAVATTLLVVQIVFVAATAVVTFRVILRQPIGPAIRRLAPAGAAGAAAAAAGWAVAAGLSSALPTPVAFGVTVCASLSAAGAALFALDRTIPGRAVALWRERVRRTDPTAA